jgi:hypothetical protein
MQTTATDRLDAAFQGAIKAIGPGNRRFGSNFGWVRRLRPDGLLLYIKYLCRISTVAVQRFCKPKVGGSNPSSGTMFWLIEPIYFPSSLFQQ